jgi:hypothetical protein
MLKPLARVVGLLPLLAVVASAQTGTVYVQHAPSINGSVQGSIQQMAGEGTNFNGGASVSGDLLVPGTPFVQLNGTPSYSGTLDGNGSTSPSNYTVTLNSQASLRHVIRRTDPASLPTMGSIPNPTGSASVTENSSGQSVNWATLKNLTLNSGAGMYTVPAGSYGSFSVNSASGITLGVAGATQASVYNFQNLTLNSGSQLAVVGPVVINVLNGFSASGSLGSSAHVSWTAVNIKSGGLTLNSGASLYGYVLAPSGTISVNGGAQLVGGSTSAYLTVNGNGSLVLQNLPAGNIPPTVSVTAPGNGTTYSTPVSFILTASASDSDGSVTKVEFFQGNTKIGEDLTSPYSFQVSGIAAGIYSYFARASDNAGATTDSTPITITVTSPNQPPVVSLTAPADGSTLTAPASLTVSASASDPDGTISRVEFYQGGSLVGSASSAPYSVSLSGIAAGTYVYSAKAYDNLGLTTTSGQATVTVVNPNLAPVVSITAPADGTSLDDPATAVVQVSASDPDGTVAKVELFENGSLIASRSQSPYQFTVSGLPVGIYDFVARATDNLSSSTDSTAVRVIVAHVNDAPVADAQSIVTVEDTPASIVLTATDPDGDPLTFAVLSGPASGSLSGTPPNLTYAPAPNFNGTDSFTFKANDGALDSAPATIAITVMPVNDIPVAASQSLTTPINMPLSIALGAIDVDGDPLTFAVATPPSHGTLSGTPPAVTYTPSPGFTGTDTFTFVANDGIANSAPATVVIAVTAGNQPPVVTLDSPASGTSFVAPANITLSATASDRDGSIASVAFFQGNTLLGTATASPYTYTWSNVAVGSYSLTAVATDNMGASTTSNAVTVTVIASGGTNQPPTVVLSAPDDGYVFHAPLAVPVVSIPFSADASDADGTITHVDFFASGVLVGSADSLPYEFNWQNVGLGSYTLMARAYDNQGASMDSASVTVTVSLSNQPPLVSLTSPSDGEQLPPGQPILLSATASDSDGRVVGVDFYSGTTLIGTATTPPYQCTWSNPPPGFATLHARAIDDSSSSTNSIPVRVTIGAANQPPVVTLSQPLGGQTLAGAGGLALAASAYDYDGSVAKVEFYESGNLIGSASAAPYNFTWTTPMIGRLILTARAYDDSGAKTDSAPVGVTFVGVDQAPVVNLLSPADGSKFSYPASILLQASASDPDGSVSRVEFWVGGAKLGEASAPPYTFTWNSAPLGAWAVTAIAFDNQGLSSSSNPVNLMVGTPVMTKNGVSVVLAGSGNQPPSAVLNSPVDGATYNEGDSVALYATAVDADGSIARVELYADGNKVGQATSKPYQFSWNGAAVGGHSLQAKSFDNLGAEGDSVVANIQVVPVPSVTVTSPSAGTSFAGSSGTSLSANASMTGGTITKVEFYQGGVLIGVAAAAPYQATWSGVKAGNYSVTARAYADNGAFADSAAVAVQATGNLPPVVSFVGPESGLTTAVGSSINLLTTSSDPDGRVTRVDYYDGSTYIGSHNFSNFDNTLNPSGISYTPSTLGTSSLFAQAFDNSGAATTAGPIDYTATSAAPASASLLAIPTGPNAAVLNASFVAQGGNLVTTEIDADGVALVQGTTDTLSFNWDSIPPDTHILEARAHDDQGGIGVSLRITLFASSNLLPSTGPSPTIPFATDFEAAEGYAAGSVATMTPWRIIQGAAEVSVADAASGTQAVVVEPTPAPSQIWMDINPPAGSPVTFVDFYAKLVADPSQGSASIFATETAHFALQQRGDIGEIMVFDGDGESGHGWVDTGASVPLDRLHRAANWHRFTIRQDYSTGTWDLYLDSGMVIADVRTADNSATYLRSFSVQGHQSVATWLDNFYAGPTNPLLPDADFDGMDDRWEVAHGLDPTLNDRNLDPDQDGLTNIQEFILGTDPNNPDTDGDGCPDGWEASHGLNPRNAADARLDPDGDGLSNLQEYQFGTDPHNPATFGFQDGQMDSDGDGIPDTLELALGTDPLDYYNGSSPVITILSGADGTLGLDGEFSVQITKADGTPLSYALVAITVVGGNNLIASSSGGFDPQTKQVVFTDANGVAQVFVQPIQFQ